MAKGETKSSLMRKFLIRREIRKNNAYAKRCLLHLYKVHKLYVNKFGFSKADSKRMCGYARLVLLIDCELDELRSELVDDIKSRLLKYAKQLYKTGCY